MRKTVSLAGFLLLFGLELVLFLVPHLIFVGSQGRKAEQVKAQQVALARLEEENKTLKDRQSLIGTDAYIVSSARDNYAYVNKNDIRFEFTNPEELYVYSEEEVSILMSELAE